MHSWTPFDLHDFSENVANYANNAL